MNLLTVLLQAPAAGPDGSLMWIMLIAMFVIMYFFILRTNHKEIHNNEHGYQHNPHHATTTGRACSGSLQEEYSH